MSTEQKRAWLKELYPWPKWSDKVGKMSDAQIHSTYMRLSNKK